MDLNNHVSETELLLTPLNIKIEEDKNFDIKDPNFKKIKQSSEQKEQMKTQLNMLVSQLPALAAAGTLAHSYKVVFPQGVVGTLLRMKNGALTSVIVGKDGKFINMAQLVSDVPAANMLGMFTAMSVVTGQYFLANINKQLKTINTKLDDILSFLEDAKKSRLRAEIIFIQDACKTYRYFMDNNDHREAYLSHILDARTIALEDMEFYSRQLVKKVEAPHFKKIEELEDLVQEVDSIRECFEMSRELYVISVFIYAAFDLAVCFNKSHKNLSF